MCLIIACSGYDVCREIRKKYTSIELPVILLTAKGMLSDVIEGFEAGANDYIMKVSACIILTYESFTSMVVLALCVCVCVCSTC